MSHKKALIIGLGGVVFFGVVLFFFSFLDGRQAKVLLQKNMKENRSTVQMGEDIQEKTDVSIEKGKQVAPCSQSLPEFGDATQNDVSAILFTTNCIVEDSREAYGGISVARAYIHGVGNEFQKKIFETRASAFDASVSGGKEGIIRLATSDGYGNNEQVYFFNRRGEQVNFDESVKEGQSAYEFTSPDNRYSATLPSSRTLDVVPTLVEVRTVSTGKVKTYDFRQEVQRLNGIRISSWSPDSRFLYIVGGIWEFSAPAKLWRIDMEKETIMSYNLQGFDFPVLVYPQDNMALVFKNGCEGKGGNMVASGRVADLSPAEKKTCSFELYRLNLAERKRSLLVVEDALGSFNNLFLDGKFLYYEVSYGYADVGQDAYRGMSAVKKVNVETGLSEMYADNESHIHLYLPEKHAMVLEQNKRMSLVSLEDQGQVYLGEKETDVVGVDERGKEYISRIEGLAK